MGAHMNERRVKTESKRKREREREDLGQLDREREEKTVGIQ